MKKKQDISIYFFIASFILGFVIILYFHNTLYHGLQAQINSLPLDYASFPTQYLYWFGIVLVALPFVFIKSDIRLRIMSLLCIFFIANFGFVLWAPYGYPYGRDSQFAYQAAQNIQEEGFWIAGSGTSQSTAYSYYPAMYLIHVNISNLTGIPLSILIMFFDSVLRFMLIPIFLYLLFRKYFDKEIALICIFLYGSTLTFINFPHHENFAIIFFVGSIYLFTKVLEKNKIADKIYFLLFSCIIIISHHFTGFIYMGWLILFITVFLVFVFFSRFKKMNLNMNLKNPVFLSLLILIFFIGWNLNLAGPVTTNFSRSLVSSLNRGIQSNINSLIIEVNPETRPLIVNQSLTVQRVSEDLMVMRKTEDVKKEKIISLSNFINYYFENIPTLINSRYPGANFTFLQIFIIGTSLMLTLIFVVYGLYNFKYILTNIFLIANLVFAVCILALTFITFLTGFSFLALRIFEFASIGYIPLIAYSLQKVYQKNKWLAYFVVLSMIIIFLASQFMIRVGTIRHFYVPKDKILSDNEFFNTPGIIGAAYWSKETFDKDTSIISDKLAEDTIGAFGRANVLIYDRRLITLFFYRSTIEDSTLDEVYKRNITIFATHKYMKTNYSFYKKINFDKFENNKRINKIYNDADVQIYRTLGNENETY